ncbi:MAG: translation initiation factor IF-3 [Candidatus Pelagibacter sp. TMED253]|nr:MAG: translation initiation factor IF-3 [Candidatus Pelagibacter sp. TMED253]
MSNFKPNYFQRRSKPQGPKANERIRAIDVQVIGSNGNNLGTLPLNKAIEIAKDEGLDLIEIAPNANPPVCKIMDIGKYKYDLQKKANIAKKKQKTVSLKEIKLRPGTDVHDYNFKIKNARKFITKGDKVKFTVKFKGREMQHTQLGKDLMNKIIEETKDIGKIESHPKFEGRQMVMIIQPI